MEQQPPQNKPEDNYMTNINKIIWFAIPMVAMLVLGVVLGSYAKGSEIEKVLLEKGVVPCQDMTGKVWLQKNVTTGILGEPINYNLSLQR